MTENNYKALHKWLQRKFGKANSCENRKNRILPFACSGISIYFNWAKLQGKIYDRKRENFIQLCRSCHVIYDENRIGKKHSFLTRKKLSDIAKTIKHKAHSLRSRSLISERKYEYWIMRKLREGKLNYNPYLTRSVNL